jgi:hypothetical protein
MIIPRLISDVFAILKALSSQLLTVSGLIFQPDFATSLVRRGAKIRQECLLAKDEVNFVFAGNNPSGDPNVVLQRLKNITVSLKL